ADNIWLSALTCSERTFSYSLSSSTETVSKSISGISLSIALTASLTLTSKANRVVTIDLPLTVSLSASTLDKDSYCALSVSATISVCSVSCNEEVSCFSSCSTSSITGFERVNPGATELTSSRVTDGPTVNFNASILGRPSAVQ